MTTLNTVASYAAAPFNAAFNAVKNNPVKTATAVALLAGGAYAYANPEVVSAVTTVAQPYVAEAGKYALNLAEKVFSDETLINWGFKELPATCVPSFTNLFGYAC